MSDLGPVIFPSWESDFTELTDVPVELSRERRVQGRLFRKHILTLGPLHYKGQTFNLDEQWYGTLRKNWDSGVCPIVQVPLANDDNKHVETPAANLGEVVGIERNGKKVYALIDARQDADKFGKTYLGASAFMHMNYEDTRTGRKVGPALLHVAVTNRPHVVDLDDYEEVVAATADIEWDLPVILTTEEQDVPTREELLAQLKAEHGIDVEALQAAAAQKTDTNALLTQITDALRDSNGVALAGDALTQSDVVSAIVELAHKNEAQATDIAALKREAAERVVDGYIGQGRLLPKSREDAVEMQLSNSSMLESFIAPEKEPYVKLDSQQGVVTPDGEDRHNTDIDAEVTRLSEVQAEVSGVKK